MKTIDTVEELKVYLDTFKIRFDQPGHNHEFIVYFTDNKSFTPVFKGIYNSPITALRILPETLKMAKLPIDDLDIILKGVLTGDIFQPTNVVLNPYMYFKEPAAAEAPKE